MEDIKRTRSIQLKLTDKQLKEFEKKAMEQGFANAAECFRFLFIRFSKEGK